MLVKKNRRTQKSLPNINIIYGVRGEPINNDVTEKEAVVSRLDRVSNTVSTGCSVPGAILEYYSKEFIDIYNISDIISKGRGNYEAFSEGKGNMFFLLKTECPMNSRKLNVNLNEYIFKYGGAKQS
ncbi:MAG: ARMT1-like domain-containing protein [Mobilitalea sp.]